MRIFIDCTDTHFSRSNTGIQRVVRSIVAHAPRVPGVECIPVAFDGGRFRPIAQPDGAATGGTRALRNRLEERYQRVAGALARALPWPPLRRFLLAHRRDPGLARILFAPVALAHAARRRLRRRAAPADIGGGDVLFLADASWFIDSLGEVARLRARGTRIAVLLYDLIPLTHPEFCQPSHVAWFDRWFERSRPLTDALLGISQASLDAYAARWPLPPAAVTHLGHDLPEPAPGPVVHAGLREALDTAAPVLLCVGTVDARKNQVVLLRALDRLWSAGRDARLVLIGRPGFRSGDVLPRIRAHPELGRRLFWFDDVDDADLRRAYGRARALVFPSLAEGFGLPIVEALALGVPVLASDIPVFREVSGDRLGYFDPRDPLDVARAIEDCLARPASAAPPHRLLSWEESTGGMIAALRRLLPPSR